MIKKVELDPEDEYFYPKLLGAFTKTAQVMCEFPLTIESQAGDAMPSIVAKMSIRVKDCLLVYTHVIDMHMLDWQDLMESIKSEVLIMNRSIDEWLAIQRITL